jgi:hypothetical protein
LLIASLIGAMFLVAILLELGSNPIIETAENNYKPNYDQENFNPLLSLLRGIETFVIAHDRFFLVLFTFAIAWFTGTLYWVTSGLLKAAEQQKADMRESLRIAAISASAAMKSAETTRAVEAAQLRLGVPPPKISVRPHQTSALVEWNPELTNVGGTIAFEINISLATSAIGGAQGAYAEPQPIPDPLPDPHPYGDSLKAGENRMIPFNLAIVQWDKVLSRENTCIVRMHVSYRDVFRTAHVIAACFYYDHRAKNFVGCPITPKSK